MMPNIQAALMYIKALKLLKKMPTIIFGAYCWNATAMDDIRRTIGDVCDIHQ